METTTTPLRYRGQNSRYVDIAVRNQEHLGFAIEYALHPSGIGCFILRFVVHGKGIDPKNYKHLTYRESAQFLISETATSSAEVIDGVRLNKLAIKAFEPAVPKHEVHKFAVKFGTWNLLSEWVAEQVEAEGFTVTVDLQHEIQSQFIPPVTPEETVKSIIELPNLAAPEEKAAALKLVKKPKADPDDDFDEDEDEDGGESIN